MRHPALFPALLFAATLAVTVPMLPHDVSFEDSAEFTAAAAVFGLPHPSGYPLYVALAHPFSLLPVGTVPWRVALFSAVCASAAVALLFVAARRLMKAGGRDLSAAAETAMFAVFLQLAATLTWFGQAITAEVYALHAALFAAIALALVRWAEKGDRRSLAAACFLFGLSCANHLYLTLVAAPAFALALAFGRPSAVRDIRAWSTAVAAFIGGLIPYALVFVMARGAYVAQPVADAASFFGLISRSTYTDVGAAGWNKFGFVLSYGSQLALELGPLVLALAGMGAWQLVRSGQRPARAALAWCVGAILAVPAVAALQTIDMSGQAEYVYRVFAVGGMAAVALLAACGSVRLVSSLSPRLAALALVAAFVIPAATWVSSARVAAAYADTFPGAFARSALQPLPENAVLIAADEGIIRDSILFGLSYLQAAERLRSDVTVINDSVVAPLVIPPLPPGYWDFDLPGRRRALIEAVAGDPRYQGRPVYTTFAAETAGDRFLSVSNGAVYRLRGRGETGFREEAAPLPPIPLALAGRQYALGAVASHALYARAARRFDEEGTRAALDTLLDAIRLDPRPFSSDYQGYMLHRAANTTPIQE